jgi:serine/threonine protein kinase
MSGLKGTVVGDRYELLGLIAEGGQALICKALDQKSGRLVAVKLLTSVAAQNREFVQRLAREQEAMVALAGTSAVAVLDLCRAPSGAPCLVMELLEGRDLEHHLCELEERGERLSFDRMFDIFDPIVDTLERAHLAGILHRDLKPANIFLLSADKGAGVRLLDFGLARMTSASRVTGTGIIMGSPSYIAPEVWKGKPDLLDKRVDVYSLSVILFRVMSGRFPFEGGTLHDKFLQATTAPRPSLSAYRPDLPQHKEIDRWIQRALAIEPEQRFPTARALWTALLGALCYSPGERPRAPVAESIVSAWRAAAGAFRRIVAGLPTPVPPPPHAEAHPTTAEPSPEWLRDDEVGDGEEEATFGLDDIFGGGQPEPEIEASSSQAEEGDVATDEASSSGPPSSRARSEPPAHPSKRAAKSTSGPRKRHTKD